ncbi:hypothetical protein CDAR_117031 [Caerostris darwini]|uniref:CTNNB1 binding N-teminal domain-containing protein n=1 Tax=Caerostris darwini TaxID=1538125 RepID=A0AAV4W960_9ARAC|nr:hypothetical protein CDAR_117031 [Caerostris darwini]
MPHVGAASGGDDLASTDELKVFKVEGDEEEDNRSSENLTELKTSLVTEGEEEKTANVPGSNEYGSPSKNSDCRPDSASHTGKPFELLSPHTAPIGYVVSPYPHPHNGSLGPVSMMFSMISTSDIHALNISPLTSFAVCGFDFLPFPQVLRILGGNPIYEITLFSPPFMFYAKQRNIIRLDGYILYPLEITSPGFFKIRFEIGLLNENAKHLCNHFLRTFYFLRNSV